MRVGEHYRIPSSANQDWIRVNRHITGIEGNYVYYDLHEHPSRIHESASFTAVKTAIAQGDWVLLYPAHVRLPIGA